MRIQLCISEKVEADNESRLLASALSRLLQTAAGHVVTSENPDIVHFLGCWDASLARKAGSISRRLIPYVYSPLGGLSPWMIAHHSVAKHAQLMAFQRKMVEHATTIHACGESERNDIVEKKWTTNVCIIENPAVTVDISEEEMLSQMLALYNEAIRRHDEKTKATINTIVSKVDEPDETINHLLREILYARYLLHQGAIPASTLDTLSSLLTKSDIDEDHFAQLLNEMKIDTFFARLECVMQAESTLTEGFMPIPMREDRQATQMIAQVTRYHS